MRIKTKVVIGYICIISISGCSKNVRSVSLPHEIANDNSTISYNDNENSNEFSEFSDIIIADDEGNIRSFNINSSNIKTYKNISVGDNISKVKELFEYEYAMDDNMYSVLLNDSKEENPIDVNKEDSWIWINYTCNNDIITNISIYDVKYGREMR